jgi:hypothetical protein
MLKYFVRKTNKQKKRTDLLISPLSLRHILNASFERSFRRVCQFFVGVSNHYFCETRPKRSVEVYKGKNLHPPQTVTDISMGTSETVTDTLGTPPSQTVTDTYSM